MRERTREIAFGLGLLASVALGLAAAEWGYRAYKARDGSERVDWAAMVAAIGQVDPAIGRTRFQPGASFGDLRFNSHGLRGPEPQVPAAADVVRLAFLGDSKMMSANVAEARTLPARTAALLGALVPACRFDYVTIAGPEYGPGVLARLWAEVAPATRPDMAVLLTGSVLELLDAGRAAAPHPAPAPPTWVDRLIARSDLLRAVRRQMVWAATWATPGRPVDLDEAALATAHAAMTAPLVAALGDTPALALGYRSRLRATQPTATRALASRAVLQAVPGLTVAEAVALAETNVAALARTARHAGWRFADPIAAIPGDDAHYIDVNHFSATALDHLAHDVAAQIAPLVRQDCTVTPQ